jgi:hypothetical protein
VPTARTAATGEQSWPVGSRRTPRIPMIWLKLQPQ